MTINKCEYFIREIQIVNGPLAELLEVTKAIAYPVQNSND